MHQAIPAPFGDDLPNLLNFHQVIALTGPAAPLEQRLLYESSISLRKSAEVAASAPALRSLTAVAEVESTINRSKEERNP